MLKKESILHIIHNHLKNNAFCIKLYSILQWHERIYVIKRFFFIDRSMKRKHFILTVKGGTKFYLPYYKTDLIQKQITQKKSFYEHDLLDNSLEDTPLKVLEKGCFLDIGANIGNHTLYFFQKNLIKSAYCFEPVKDTFDILKKNIEINKLQNKVNLFNVGVGQTKGKAVLKYYNSNNIGMSQLSSAPNGDIPIVSIDDLNIEEKINFVKIDVEGFEANVIKGMTETLKRNKPLIMIEIRDYLFAEINNILQSLGYNHTTIDVDTCNIGNYLYYTQK